MNNRPQYVIRQGKIPVSHLTGIPVDPLKRENWIPRAAAELIASTWGPCYGIGFVLTADDPYFFLDLDHVVDAAGQWNDIARDFQDRFQGCYLERSQSGDGMHIIGQTSPVAHSCRQKDFPVELYTRDRMISLTGTEATGSPDIDGTEVLIEVVNSFFPPKIPQEESAWTTEPVEGYGSKHTDAELIELALRPRAKDVFGGVSSFADLWSGKYTDHSAADLQLCNHLAFWTGGDCSRIERLFSESELVRPKWTDREDYRQRTILAAVSSCETYFSVSPVRQGTTLGFRWNVVFPEVKANGRPRATAENLKFLLEMAGIVCRHNEMSHEDEVIVPGIPIPQELQYRSAIADIRSLCASTDLPSTFMPEYVDRFCSANHFHPAKQWIESMEWDGIDRISALVVSLNPDRFEVAAILLRRWLISAVAALYDFNGVETGGMIVLQGPQEMGKTQWFKSLVGVNEDLLKTGSILDMNSRDSISQNLKHWLIELGELDGSLSKSEIAQLKAFITNGSDSFREAYARKAFKYPRRTVYIGTVNQEDYLRDETGNRRFWTISCNRNLNCNHGINTQQLWAQVLNIYQAGESHHLTPTESKLLTTVNEHHRPVSIVEQMVKSFYDMDGPRTREMTTAEVLKEIGHPLPIKNDRGACKSIALALGVKGPFRNTKNNSVFFMPATTVFTKNG